MRNKLSTSVFIGLILLVLGVGFFLQSLDFINFGDTFGKYWPIFVLLFAILKLFEARWTSAAIWGIIGIILLVNTATTAHIDFWQAIWPIILIRVGLSILMRGNWRSQAVEDPDDRLSSVAVFGASDRKSSAKAFKGANLTALFGSNKLDLRKAKIADKGADIDVFVAFGGAEIFIPKDVPVKLDVFALFGGSEDKRKAPAENGKKGKITIRGTAFFGGVEIKE